MPRKKRPVHGNAVFVNSITNIHRENVVPLLEVFFCKEVLPYAGPRPTLFTDNFFTKKNVDAVPSNGVQELNPVALLGITDGW